MDVQNGQHRTTDRLAGLKRDKIVARDDFACILTRPYRIAPVTENPTKNLLFQPLQTG